MSNTTQFRWGEAYTVVVPAQNRPVCTTANQYFDWRVANSAGQHPRCHPGVGRLLTYSERIAYREDCTTDAVRVDPFGRLVKFGEFQSHHEVLGTGQDGSALIGPVTMRRKTARVKSAK